MHFVAAAQSRFAIGSGQAPGKALYKFESVFHDSTGWVFLIGFYAMKIALSIDVKIDLANVIYALTGLCVAIANIIQYF